MLNEDKCAAVCLMIVSAMYQDEVSCDAYHLVPAADHTKSAWIVGRTSAVYLYAPVVVYGVVT